MKKIQLFFRKNSVSIAVVVIFLSLAGIITLQAIALSTLTEQSKKQNSLLVEIKKNAEQRTSQIKALDHHLDCIAIFFAQSDRDEKAIKNIDDCVIGSSPTTPVATPEPITITKPVPYPVYQPAPAPTKGHKK